MKLNFKKIVPIAAGALMLGATAFGAVAADLGNWPAPFVSGGAADVTVVYGAAGMAIDAAAAADVVGNMQAALSGVSTGTTTTTTSGETAKIETAGQKLYMGDYMGNVKETLTKSDLPTVLADGSVTDTEGKSYDYTQKIGVANTTVTYDKDTPETDEPILYVDLNNNGDNYAYTDDVTFTTAVNTTKLAGKDITLFGKTLTFSASSSELNASSSTGLVLYTGKADVTVNAGESKDVTVGDSTMTVEILGVDTSGNKATIKVTSGSTTETATLDKGDTKMVAGQRIYCKDILALYKEGSTTSYGGAELFIGADKIALINSTEVELNGNPVYGTTVTNTVTSNKLSKISIQVTPYSFDNPIKYIGVGDSLTDPVFKSFKISFGGANPALDDASRDAIVLKASGEKTMELDFTNKDGDAYSLNVIKPTSEGSNNTNVSLGVGENYQLVTDGLNITENDYFIVGHNEYSYIYRLTRIDTNNDKIRIRDASGGSDIEYTIDSNNQAEITLPDGSTVTANVTTSHINLTSESQSYVYTKDGAKIDLSGISANAAGYGTINITEETPYNDGDFTDSNGNSLGTNIIIDVKYEDGSSGDDIGISNVHNVTMDGVGDYDTQGVTNYGTFVKRHDGSGADKVELYYYGSATSYDVYYAEETATITAGTSGGVTGAQLGSVTFADNELTSELKAKNLVVIGGSAINSVAADMLGLSYPTYGSSDAWQNATGVSASGNAILKLATNPYASDKMALLIAGWDGVDTQRAAKALINKVDGLSGKESVVLNTNQETAVVIA